MSPRSPRSPRFPKSPRAEGRNRRAGQRVLSILALVFVLLPLQGTLDRATSAPAQTTTRAAQPKVFLALKKSRVTNKQHARAKVVVAAPGSRVQRKLFGQVKVLVKGGGKTRSVVAGMADHRTVVTLPKLSRGFYKVRAEFLGNQRLGKAHSRFKKLTVIRAGGGGGGAASCASTTSNVPDGADGKGGCFPGPANTGPSAPASSMGTYAGPCTITGANTVIDSKVVNCRTIDVRAAGFVLKNSYLNGGIVQSGGTPAFTVLDSFIDSGVQYPACSNGSCPAGKYACGDTSNATTNCGVTGSNFTILRTEIINSNRAAYCESSCLIRDSYFHGTNLWPDASNLAHASSVREEQNLTLRHNSLHCSYTGPFVNGEIGCSADLTGYADFAPIKNNTVDGNLFVASPGSAFCIYGGSTTGKPYSSDPTNGTNQKFTGNVFQRGSNRKCSAYGPVTNFDRNATGNVWSGNVWDDGTPVAPAN